MADMKVEILEGLLGDLYSIFPIQVGLSDVGHSGTRNRLYIILACKEKLLMLHNPTDLYSHVSSELKQLGSTQPGDYLTAGNLEIQLDAMEVATSGKIFRSNMQDLSYLLSERERLVVTQLSDEYRRRFNADPADNRNLVYFTGDNPTFAMTWSGASNRLPTFRRNAATGKFWFPAAQRWLTNCEKLLGPQMLFVT
ncbi:unnamed protein product [Effrenium voratum]|uniref:Uncharacterized protein n=1 Tax=Effrenium voratum TaxID=2562239 RepID=A0AA36JC26_9DINO|nr:unnamed protein product [Effrenium voratum]CAJ1430080.1 unnamed protein product [Effrenium voratum]